MSQQIDPQNYKSLSALIGGYLTVDMAGGLDDAIKSFHLPDEIGETQQIIQDIDVMLDANHSEDSLRQYFAQQHFLYYFVNDSAIETLIHIKEVLTDCLE